MCLSITETSRTLLFRRKRNTSAWQYYCLDVLPHKLGLLFRQKSSETPKGGLLLNCMILFLSFLKVLDN